MNYNMKKSVQSSAPTFGANGATLPVKSMNEQIQKQKQAIIKVYINGPILEHWIPP